MKALDEKRINTTLNVWCRCKRKMADKMTAKVPSFLFLKPLESNFFFFNNFFSFSFSFSFSFLFFLFIIDYISIGPFLVSCVVLNVIQCHMHQPPTHVLLMRIFCMLINWWNGLYFMVCSLSLSLFLKSVSSHISYASPQLPPFV